MAGNTPQQTNYKICVKTEGAVHESSEMTIPTGWATHSNTWTTNPEVGGAWTWAQVDALQIGVSMRASIETQIPTYCTQVYVEVDYTSGVTHEGAATLSGTGTLAGIGRLIAIGKAALSGSGTLAAIGAFIRYGQAALSGTGTLAGIGLVFKLGAASLSGVGNLTASAVAIFAGKAALSGAGSLAASARSILASAATLSGEGSLAVSAIIVLFGKATLSGLGTLSAQGIRIANGIATLAGAGLLSAAAKVFGLLATLQAAQKKPDRLPYVEAKVYDFEQGIKRLSWTRLYTGSEPDNHHGIAFDGHGSMHRIRAAASNKLYHQKITSPDAESDYTSWTEIASDCAGPCAIAAYGAKVYIFYRKTDNTLRKYYSHDYGANWTPAQLVAYADVLSMAACWWGTGDIVVCFALKASEVNGIVLDSSDQSTGQNTWNDATHPLSTTYGIGATYNSFWPGCEIVFAGKETDTPYNHYNLFRTLFSDTYNFTALESFLMSPEGEDITYEYPDCHLPSSPESCETTRITAVEKFTGTTAYTLPLTSHLVKGTYFSDTTFTEPKPFLDLTSDYGLRLRSTADYWWLERPDGVWRAARPAGDPLDLTGDIIAVTQRIAPGRGEDTSLILTLDNSAGKYASPGTGGLASLRFRSEIVLKLGYKTTEGSLAVEAGTYWVDGWEWTSDPGLSTLRLLCLDAWGLADRWSARYQMRWNKDAVGPKNVWNIIYLVLARFGIRLWNNPAVTRSSAILNLYPDFTINPGTAGDTAIRRLLSLVPDGLIVTGQEAFTKDLKDDEASSYTYGTDHTILSGEYSQHVPTNRARAIGRTAGGARILEDAFDWDLLAEAIDILQQDYDPNLDDATRTQERADAILRMASLRSQRGVITIPTNCGQELYDVITLTDVRVGISSEKYRVAAIQTDYNRSKAIYNQRLSLCAP